MTAASTWLGIDLGGTFLKWEVVSGDGESLESGKVPTPQTGHLDVTRAIVDIVNALQREGTIFSGAGVAVPGHIAQTREEITFLPNVPGEWLGYPIAAHLLERTGVRAVLLNDARSFALAELELGAARGESDVVFATIGTGIGGAVAVDGRIVSSRRDSFGEIGHTTAVVGGDACTCGGIGCVEAYAGGTQVLLRAARRGVSIEAGPEALVSLALAARTDAVARDVLDEAYDAFAIGVSSICAFSGSRVVVVGGAVASELPGYLEAARARLEERRVLLGAVEVRRALLGARAGALGAALAARRDRSSTNRELEYHA